MANEEQLAILKEGVDVWNQWREENPDVEINLREVHFEFRILGGVNLKRADLFGANFLNASLSKANLYEANLMKAHLADVNLDRADLRGADLTGADLTRASLVGTKLNGANLTVTRCRDADLTDANLFRSEMGIADFTNAKLVRANLDMAYLSNTNLRGADLSDANLVEVNLSKANLKISNFTQGVFLNTILGNNDLSTTIGLETINHQGASTVGIDTIQKSKGKIPVEFLRGCGLSDIDIEYAKLANPDLSNEEISKITQNIFDLKATRPIQISPLFISYSHANSNFVDKIETKLNDNGIRFWRDIHDATAGRLETQIDRAIRHNPTVLLILSEHSTNSDWVEHEARLARKLEKGINRDVLCPIALDDSWKTCHWPERIKEQIMEYNILDFSNWEDDDELDAMFKKLIDGLDMFYKG